MELSIPCSARGEISCSSITCSRSILHRLGIVTCSSSPRCTGYDPYPSAARSPALRPPAEEFLVSGLEFRASGLGFRVSVSSFRVSGLGSRVSGFRSRVSGLESRISGFESRVSGFKSRVSGFGFRVSGFGLRVSGLGIRDSGFGFPVSGFGVRDSGFEIRVSGFGIRVAGRDRQGDRAGVVRHLLEVSFESVCASAFSLSRSLSPPLPLSPSMCLSVFPEGRGTRPAGRQGRGRRVVGHLLGVCGPDPGLISHNIFIN